MPFEARDPIDFDKNAEGWQTMATKAGMAIGYATNHDAVVNRLKETPRETTAASMLKQLGNEFYFLQHKGVLKGKRIAETVNKLRDGSILHKASSYANQRVKTAFIVADSIFDLGFTTKTTAGVELTNGFVQEPKKSELWSCTSRYPTRGSSKKSCSHC